MQARSQLMKLQRKEQSGSTLGRPTSDRILVHRVPMERRREFRQMFVTYVELKKTFDLVHCEGL